MSLFRMAYNVRRYVQLPQSRGGALCPVPKRSEVGVFLHSWYGAGLSGYYFILALAKTVTPGGSPRPEPGRAAPPTTWLSSLARKFSRHRSQ